MDIWSYIAAESSETIADRFIEKLHIASKNLADFPASRQERSELAPGLRMAVYQNYALYYLYNTETVTIVRILHGARDLKAIADQGGFQSQP